MRYKLLFSLVILAVVSCNQETEKVTTEATATHDAKSVIKTSLPQFHMHDVNGKTIDLQSLKGKKLLVNLWATWCPPCRKELPSMEKLRKSVDSSRVAFLFVSLDDDFEKAIKYMRSTKLDLPVYYPAENLPGLFNVDAIPATFIFDEYGELIHQMIGAEDYNTPRYKKMLK